MVADRGHVVAQLIHYLDDVFALGERAYRVALNGVADVDEQHLLAHLLKCLLCKRDGLVAEVLIDGAVNIIGEEYRNFSAAVLHSVRVCRGRHYRENHEECEQQRKKFSVHLFASLIIYQPDR